jgi:hypothetical protein
LSEKTAFTSQEIGYRWHITIDKELRIETGAKYPDKTTIHASLEGHEDTVAQASAAINAAKKTLESLTKEEEAGGDKNAEKED